MLNAYEQQRITTVVHYENETRKVLNIEAPRVYNILNEYVGKKIYKADGTLLKAIADKISFLSHDIQPLDAGGNASLRIWLHTNNGSVYIATSICYSNGKESGCSYYEGSAYICSMKYGRGILDYMYPLTDRPELDTTFQLEQADKIKDIKATLSAEEDRIFYAIRRL